jgi:Protein of unknown function (DUF3999)
MMRAGLCLFGLLMGWGELHAKELPPQDFAFGLPVTVSGEAAAYRFPLPLPVYQNTFREDLGDVRIYNAHGITVPFSLLRPTLPSPIHEDAVALPLFPLHEGFRAVLDGVRVTINSAGSAVNLQTQNGTPAVTWIGQYLLDGRALDTVVSALQLDWPKDAAEYSGRLRVEASDDLASWRTVADAAPIANLRANGQTLIENRVTLSPTKAKFWRISWLGAAPTFELTSVLAEPADSPTEPKRSVLDVAGVRGSGNAAEYVFDLSAHPPVSRINVLLPDANTVVEVALSSRRGPGDPWRPVMRAGFYRVKGADGEQQNSPLQISVDSDRYWQAKLLNSGGPPQSPLRLHVEWIPDEITFLAQGEGPFQLVYGNSTATHAETDLSRLPVSLEIAPATAGTSVTLGGPTRLAVKPAPFPRTRVVLWSVLLLAVIVLASMAYRLSRETRNHPE